jgi:hypothetical protein
MEKELQIKLEMSKDSAARLGTPVAHDEGTAMTESKDASLGDKLRSKDIGAKYAAAADDAEFDTATQRKYLWRVDLVLMPILFLTWGLQYADKSILNSAAQFGIVDDLGLSDTVLVHGRKSVSLSKFSYAVMLFYWGYFVGGT